MNGTTYDVIVVGGGHNGLTAAAALAAGGRKVALLEQRDEVGGLAAGRTFAAGHRSAGVLQDTAGLRPRVVAALQLEQHGLRRRPAAPLLALGTDGPGLLVWRDALRMQAELAKHAPGDGARYGEFRAFVAALRPLVAALLDAPPPPIGARGVHGLRVLAGPALALRRLGRDTMLECLRMAPMCLRDWLDEWFEDPLLKAALAGPALHGAWTGPWSAGTAALLVMQESMAGDEVVGGPAALVRALSSACAAAGVDVRTGTPARRLIVRDGAVTGVELGGGGALEAPVVASSLDPGSTLLELVAPRDLPADLEPEAESWRCRGTTALLDLALRRPLVFAGRASDTFHRVHVASSLAAIERAFDAVKYRRMSEHPVLDVHLPETASDGKHVASVLVHHAPYDLEGGWTDAARATLLERTLAALERHVPGVRDDIVGHDLLVPPDLEAEYGCRGGHLQHGEHGLDQLFWLRPMASCAQYATPLRGLFLCGSGSHPGGGITCGPGMLAAGAITRT